LHLALVLPRPRAITHEHPYIFGWIYGISALAPVAWLLTWSLAPIMGGQVGMNVGFLLKKHFLGISEEAQAGIALLCLAGMLTTAAKVYRGIRLRGWRASILGHPYRTLGSAVLLPACGALAIAASCSLLEAPETVLHAAGLSVHTVLYSEVVAARSVVLLGFPVAICLSLFRGGVGDPLRDEAGTSNLPSSRDAVTTPRLISPLFRAPAEYP